MHLQSFPAKSMQLAISFNATVHHHPGMVPIICSFHFHNHILDYPSLNSRLKTGLSELTLYQKLQPRENKTFRCKDR